MVVYISRDNSAALAHYGVKGMKWGVRKERETHSVKTKGGETLTLVRRRPLFGSKNNYSYALKVGKKKVGNLYLDQKPNKEMNINWGDIRAKYRNKGYMSAALKGGEEIARKLGNVRMTAELVGNSPGDSIHKLAKKYGYVKVGEDMSKEAMDAWNGLTFVEKRLK